MVNDVKLHIPMMLHKTLRDEIYFMKSWKLFSRLVLHKRGEGCGKESTVVARTPVDGSCVTHTVHQIESHTSPQDIGKTLLRRNSTQSIRKRKKQPVTEKAERCCVTHTVKHAEYQRTHRRNMSQNDRKKIPLPP